MDWFSWLSKTSLDLTLVYDYGVVFACNELTAEDIPHFDHGFLQSMGITAAKHRLEIIKVARSETRSKAGGVSGRVREAINKTKKKVVECAKKLMNHSHDELRGGIKSSGFRSPKPRMMRSGPLVRSNGQARIISRGHSGPLAPSSWFPGECGKSPLVPLTPSMCRSPRGLEGNDGIESLWAKLFQDMKPT